MTSWPKFTALMPTGLNSLFSLLSHRFVIDRKLRLKTILFVSSVDYDASDKQSNWYFLMTNPQTAVDGNLLS
jgi:hypothetical protein